MKTIENGLHAKFTNFQPSNGDAQGSMKASQLIDIVDVLTMSSCMPEFVDLVLSPF